MKKVILIAIMTICMATAARADLYVDYVDDMEHSLVSYWQSTGWFSGYVVNDESAWDHENPFVGDYEAALAAGLINGVTLNINASGIESGADDVVGVGFLDKNGFDHDLGRIYDGDNILTLDPTWIDGVTVKATLYLDGWLDTYDSASINSSALTVDGTPVPVPGAVLLGLLGLSAAGIKLRKHA